MNMFITMNIWSVLCIFVSIISSPFAQAASFNCAKAQTKVERTICDDLEISRLDEELARRYKTALQDQTSADEIKREQKQWLKERNQCSDISCLRERYSKRVAELSETEHYTLKMSKDDELCNHMLQLFNEDLKKYGWNGDVHQEAHEEFKQVPWQPARFKSVIDGRTEYTDVEGALFDLNNDGVQDFVVRQIGSFRNTRADAVYLLDKSASSRANTLTVEELRDGKNQIVIYSSGYELLSPLVGEAEIFQILEPFSFHGKAYLVMRPIFEAQRFMTGYAVIAKYGGGKFSSQELTGEMEDVCYYQRNRAKRSR